MDLVDFAEDEIVKYILQEYAGERLRGFACMRDVLDALPHDMVEDLKDEIWDRLLCMMGGHSMLARIAECAPEESSDEEE